MALGVSRNPVVLSPFSVSSLLDYSTHRNLLSRPERCCISARFTAYIAYCVGVALQVELCKVTERKYCRPEASESAMGPWSLYPARYETYEESHVQAFFVLPFITILCQQ